MPKTLRLHSKQFDVETLLLSLLSLQCLGYGLSAWSQDLELNSVFLVSLGLEKTLAFAFPFFLGGFFLISAIALLIRPTDRLLLCLFAVFLFLTLLKTGQMGSFWGLTPISRASRYFLPLGIWMLRQSERPGALSLPIRGWVQSLLVLGLSATFVGHGFKALCLSPKFESLLVDSVALFGIPATIPTTAVLLSIGIVDFVAAFALWLFRSKAAALYMGVWAFVAAFSRILAGGIGQFDEVLVRASYYGTAFVLFLCWTQKLAHFRGIAGAYSGTKSEASPSYAPN